MELVFLIFLVYFLLKIGSKNKPRGSTQRRLPFKKRYDLDRRQPINIFEEKMAKAMLSEGKEVFVTAFCKANKVLTVTATVGSKNQCRPSDNFHNWGNKAYRLGATQIRQYHNHPAVLGRSFISAKDRESNAFFCTLLEGDRIEFVSFLVFPSRLGGYQIQRYE